MYSALCYTCQNNLKLFTHPYYLPTISSYGNQCKFILFLIYAGDSQTLLLCRDLGHKKKKIKTNLQKRREKHKPPSKHRPHHRNINLGPIFHYSIWSTTKILSRKVDPKTIILLTCIPLIPRTLFERVPPLHFVSSLDQSHPITSNPRNHDRNGLELQSNTTHRRTN